MIIGLSIENLKGIRERVELELAPITLLFGANNAGKSIVADALDYFEALLSARSPSAALVGLISRTRLGKFRLQLPKVKAYERAVVLVIQVPLQPGN